MSAIVTVGPREIHDLVYRASRVAGCHAGIADRLAESVTFAEIHHGASVETFLAALFAGNLADSAYAAAPDRLARAEVAARSEGEAIATFDPPVPLAAIAASLWLTSGRGVQPAEDFAGAAGATEVTEVHLGAADVDRAWAARVDQRHTDAHRHGVILDRMWFSSLGEAAAEFLVAEATLDEIADD